MLFQGQEFGASSPFTYFADHQPELGKLVYQGRLKFVSQFPSLARPESQARVPDPRRSETFEMCKLRDEERAAHGRIYQLHRDLLDLRRKDVVFRRQGADGFDGAVLGPRTLALRFFGAGGDRLLIINLEVDLEFDPAPEPLIAAGKDSVWQLLWSSEHPKYGGRGVLEPPEKGNWIIQGYSAIVLQNVSVPQPESPKKGARKE